MRRTAAILLLPIMVIFAIQPVIAMHYCGGKLRSVDFSARQVVTDTHINHGDPACCCHSHKTGTDKHRDDLYITGSECCDTELVELSTDDYQNRIDLQTFRLLSVSIDNIASIPAGTIQLADPETDLRTPLQEFPPGGLFLADINLLTYICTYRI